jgi:GLPGLI family protein
MPLARVFHILAQTTQSIMNVLQTSAFIFLLVSGVSAPAQKTVSDITLVYDITVETSGQQPTMANMFNGATTTVYIKGASHRTEAVNALGSSTTIYDGKTNKAVLLKEYGAQKLLVRMTADNWKESNKKYEGVTYTIGTETKVIAGYTCTKATGKLTDGTQFTVFFTKDLVPENKEYNLQFKGLNGLVLEYAFDLGGIKVVNTVSKLSMGPIAPAKFEVPKSGYREMTYEESLKN